MKTEEEKLKKKLKVSTVAIVVLLIVLLIILCVVLVKIFSVKDGIGNNDSNMGLVTQSDDATFYYNYNKGLVRKEKKEEKTLTKDQAYSINYFDGNVYYTTPNSTGGIDIKKIGQDGKNEQIILSTTSSSTKMYLNNSKIYYLTSNPNTISRVDIDGKNPQVLLKRGVVDFKVVDETIYFSDIMGYLYSIDLDGENYKTLIKESSFDEFQILDDYVYYFDNEKGKLMKVSLKDTSKKKEVTDKLDCDTYNVTTVGIFYLNKKNSKICMVSSNGKKSKELVSVNTDNTKINIAGNILYYIDNDKSSIVTKMIGTNGKKVN